MAYLLGLGASCLKLPPLVGYLGGGVLLYLLGQESSELLYDIGHIGVLLLLFTVGLHIRLRSIFRAEVFGAGTLHLAFSVGLFTVLGLVVGLEVTAAVVTSIILGFSSTVLAAKTLENRSELDSYHGRTAIGVLILQDLVAIAVLAMSGLEAPSLWVFLLLLVPLLRPFLTRLLEASRHDELLLLYGLLLALGGGALFELLGLSSELGALAAGALLAGTEKADELAEKLWGLKEAFLVGFFLEIGLGGLPPVGGVLIAVGLVLLLPLRGALYFLLMAAFKLRVRNGFMIGASLTSYSEFALIAGAAAAAGGLIPESSLLVLALAVVLSFAVAAPLNRNVHDLYERLEPILCRFERRTRHPDHAPMSLGRARSLVFGMGRTGVSAYSALADRDMRPLGLDSDPAKIERHRRDGRRVIYGDAEDPELWDDVSISGLEAVILALPDLEARLHAIESLRERDFTGVISTVSMYPEEEEPLREAGADVIAHPLSEAGFGLAEQSLRLPTKESR